MCRKMALFMVALWAMSVGASAANERFTIVIDPGHGGHDAGAQGAFSKEKDINLKVALRLGEYVEKKLPGVKVVYTRKDDVFVSLKQRANIANKAGGDLFVSVHTNALPAGKVARGFEVYTLGMHRAKDNLDVAMRENSVISMEEDYRQTYAGFDPKSSESYIIFEFIQGKNMERSVDLARMIQRSVCGGANRPNKGVHQAGFLVLRETSMPGCLIELGFITTPDEERLLNNAGRIDDMAKAIFQGIARYRNKYDARLSVPYRASGDDDSDVPSVVPVNYRKTHEANEPDSLTVEKGRDDSKARRTQKTDDRKGKSVKPVEERQRKAGEKFESTMEKKIPGKVGGTEEQASQSTAREETEGVPVFKVQILTSGNLLKPSDARLKGEKGYDTYREGGLVKYTVGASANYNEIYRLRKTLVEKFPEAFIIAFKDGKKYDVQQAIREFKQNKNR